MHKTAADNNNAMGEKVLVQLLHGANMQREEEVL